MLHIEVQKLKGLEDWLDLLLEELLHYPLQKKGLHALELHENGSLIEVQVDFLLCCNLLINHWPQNILKQFVEGKEIVALRDLEAVAQLVLLLVVDLDQSLLVLLNDVGEDFQDFERQLLDLLGKHDLERLRQYLHQIVRRPRAQHLILHFLDGVLEVDLLSQDVDDQGIDLRMYLA